MNSSNEMSISQKLINFGVSIGMPDSKAVSSTNRFIAKPIEWLSGQENYTNTSKTANFICRHVLARIVGIAASVFAAIDFSYNLIATLGKLPLAALKAAGMKQIPESCSFRGTLENIQNLGQSILLTLGGSIVGIIAPRQLAKLCYPLSERNKTPIFGYHEVSTDVTDPWTISPELFYKHLEHLHKKNYELCTMKEFNDGYEPSDGKKLAVLTFDDSHESQFRYLADDKIDPTCAIGVFEKMKKDYPDFRCAATFYVNTSEDSGTTGDTQHTLFASNEDQKKFTNKKLEYLKDNNYEIGAHGHKHRVFKKLTKKELEKDVKDFDKTIADTNVVNPKDIVSFAWPHGISAKRQDRKLFEDRFETLADFGFHAGKVDRNRMNSKRIPRIFIGPNTGFEKYAP